MTWLEALRTSLGGNLVAAAAGLTIVIALVVRAWQRSGSETHKRGVLIRHLAARRRPSVFSRSQEGGLTLAGVPVPLRDETKHFKLIGTTGTGKSTAIGELLRSALARGDRAIVADPDGGYRARFFDKYRGDVILNPFERGSVKWDPFSEINESHDVEQLASGLIPAGADSSANEWRGYARTFLSAVLRRRAHAQRLDSTELWRLLAVASIEELKTIVAGTPAQPFLDPDNTRMFGSIRSVTLSAVAAFEHVQAQRGAPFSIRRWVRDGAKAGTLFIPYQAGQIAALKSMIATWMRLAIFEAMNAEENRDQHLWFVIDELDALGAMDGLRDALARLRKFGGRCVLGFQSVAQVSSTCGAGDAQTIVENCGNTLILRCSGSENGGTSQFASRLIGEREILRRQISRGSDREGSFSSRGARRSRNTSELHVIEAAVLPSEIEKLPDFSGYFKPASSHEWLKVSFDRSRPRAR